jgi:NIMA (never in mitosis gene a)-related kinase
LCLCVRNRAKKKHYFSEEEIVDMFLQVAMGLHHIHTKRVLHRDLKTQNIFVARGGILKLGDFGISKVTSGAHSCIPISQLPPIKFNSYGNISAT